MESRQTVFSPVQEAELSLYLKEQEIQLAGLTTMELRELAYQMAEKNGIIHPFKHGIAGEDWMRGFLRRSATLSLRKPQATSVARAMCFNKVLLGNYFDLLYTRLTLGTGTANTELRYPPGRRFNLDETGFSINPKDLARIVAEKGKKQVGKRVPSDRGKLVTVELCISADGNFLPPAFIFPRKNMRSSLLTGGLEGSWGMANPSGWINADLFHQWFQWFVEIVKPTSESPVLLLVDGHTSHTQNYNMLQFARKNHVVIICFPPHCTHRLQPLDVAVMKPLSTYYADAINTWMRQNPGRVLTEYEICALIGAALQRSATPATIMSAFRTTGIYPYNREVFSDTFFSPEPETPEPEPQSNDESEDSANSVRDAIDEDYQQSEPLIASPYLLNGTSSLGLSQSEDCQQDEPVIDQEPIAGPSRSPMSPTPGRARIHAPMQYTFDDSSETGEDEPQVNFSYTQKGVVLNPRKAAQNILFQIPPMTLQPLPTTTDKPTRKSHTRGKTAVLTSKEYLSELKSKQDEAKEKEERKKNNSKKKSANMKRTIPWKKKKNVSETSDTENDAACLYCGGLWSESNERWIECESCRNWAHISCAHVSSDEEDPDFICNKC